MSFVHIQKVKRNDPLTGLMVERYAVPAVALTTPQGKKLIPNPSGNEACLFDTLEEAEEAVQRAGFDYVFEGKKTYSLQKTKAAGASPAKIFSDPLRASVPILIARLQDKEMAVVANAALALGEIGAPESVRSLCEILGHEDQGVRKNVAEALAKMGQSSLEHLRQAWKTHQQSKFKDAPYVRLTIMTAYLYLAQLHRDLISEFLPQAVEALEDESWLVRAQAALVLGSVGSFYRDER